jgi:hypothetical protein
MSHPTKVGPESGPKTDRECRPWPVTPRGAATDTETCKPHHVCWGRGGREGDKHVALTLPTVRIVFGLADGGKGSQIDQRSVA